MGSPERPGKGLTEQGIGPAPNPVLVKTRKKIGGVHFKKEKG